MKLYFAKVSVVVSVVVVAVAEFVISVDFSAVASVITVLLFSVLDRLPCMKTHIALSSIFDRPLEENLIFFFRVKSIWNVKNARPRNTYR